MMRYQKLILLLLMCIFCLSTKPVCAAPQGQSGGAQGKQGAKIVEPQPYIKHVIIMAIDDLEEKYFNPGVMPRLYGLSQEGIAGRTIDINPVKEPMPQEKLIIRELPEVYRTSQRKSMLVEGRIRDPWGVGSFNYIFSSDSKEKVSPKTVLSTAAEQFTANQPYLTYITLGNPPKSKLSDQQFFKQADEAFGNLLVMLQDKALYNYTLFVITGRRSLDSWNQVITKGKDSPLVYPLVLRGPNLYNGLQIPAVNLVDMAPTILYLTDGKESSGPGHVLWSILKTDNYYVNQSLLRRRIEDVSKERDTFVQQAWQWEKEKQQFNRQKALLSVESAGFRDKLNSKDKEISQLNNKLDLYHVAAVITIIGVLIGFVVEYFILRKRFLLF
ncbi:MAG TPA: hypothetical protein VHS59_11305 [Bacillota bacterium]|nr:hypothetical protein [Bacillota bacterium]